MPLHKLVNVSSGGIHGRCWFAAEDIPAGEMIWWAPEKPDVEETRVTIAEMESWPAEKRDRFMLLAYQLDENTMGGFIDEDAVPYDILKENFVNHSCDGNCWYDGIELYSCKDIKKGEEICYDYALTEAHSSFKLKCLCGKALCRGMITGNDWKLPELRARYGNHFMPHIMEKIQAEQQ